MFLTLTKVSVGVDIKKVKNMCELEGRRAARQVWEEVWGMIRGLYSGGETNLELYQENQIIPFIPAEGPNRECLVIHVRTRAYGCL